MKLSLLFALLFSMGLLASCTSTEDTIDPATATTKPTTTTATPGSLTNTPAVSDPAGQTATGLQGTFVNGVHAVSGTVKVVDTAGKRTLVFSNFKSDSGPDLRIYLAENTGLRNFIELSRLENSGNFSVDLPAQADPAKQRYVLIWCKAFSVHFGNAELK